ncbi:hypothetical protein AAFF_G00179490 [Aldrovandia affinis]|uniref:Uncharacterized protein n=1 Tax=Aldrovandia affinis TaxID=143900 RepID=A0AAD7RKA4_9TELE|nr:hypothetical protein AAFF_G00179490 [Aldrovandia affinis]
MNHVCFPLLLGSLLSLLSCSLEEGEENVAFGKKATQSTSTNAYKAIDGKRNTRYTDGSCTHTWGDSLPWWRVDLLHSHKVTSVAITNRGDCCPERINGAEIHIGNSLYNNGNSNPVCAVVPQIPAGQTTTYECQGMEGRYVNIFIPKLAVLTLCEVEVYGNLIHEANFAIHHSNCNLTSCGPLAQCTSDGGCVCSPGYRLPVDILPNSDSYGCADIDECVEESTICGPNATCTNTPGGHTCTCHQGYLVIPPDSMASTSNPCQDVDECSQSTCGSNAVCYNTVGGYYCSCQDGYMSSTDLNWEFGVTLCQSAQEHLHSLTPPEGQSPEIFFLNKLSQELENNPDIILAEGTVTSVLTTALLVTDNMSPEDGEDNSAEAASVILKISERLVSALVEPTKTQSKKTVKTPSMEINIHVIGPEGNITEVPALNAKENIMTINLPAIAKNNNGSVAAVLMSVSGMEKLMSPSFFRTENVTEMYSDIITATLLKTNDTELPEPVNFTIHHKKKYQAGLVTCVYWEDKGLEKHWSVKGCTASFSDENHTVCSCTHLSTFAILLQTEEQHAKEGDPLLEWINLVCMCVGLAFLALAILSFLFCSWNPKINNTARLHLSICLFSAHLLFMVGMSQTENTVLCAVIAGMLHFLFLSSFVWMLLETVQLFLLVRCLAKVQVIQREGLESWYLLLIGYGAPVVVVGVSAGVFSDGYGSKEQCWLEKDKNFQWSFIGPVCSILALNLVSFCVIIWSLKPTLVNMKSNISQARDTRLIVFKIVAQFFILGCAWILGFFQSSTVLKYLFIVLNSQQGTFIFVVHCLLNKEVREEYRRWLTCLCRAEEPSQTPTCMNIVNDSVKAASPSTEEMDKVS